mmetsp:Transcript_4627/g.16288  ORF Transcript_4627/g.16288 Transcript_4627/m.16288 type:complete len:253 (-) Transcript_4627:61-819(-)
MLEDQREVRVRTGEIGEQHDRLGQDVVRRVLEEGSCELHASAAADLLLEFLCAREVREGQRRVGGDHFVVVAAEEADEGRHHVGGEQLRVLLGARRNVDEALQRIEVCLALAYPQVREVVLHLLVQGKVAHILCFAVPRLRAAARLRPLGHGRSGGRLPVRRAWRVDQQAVAAARPQPSAPSEISHGWTVGLAGGVHSGLRRATAAPCSVASALSSVAPRHSARRALGAGSRARTDHYPLRRWPVTHLWSVA